MKAPGTKEILSIWERNIGKPLIEKTIDLLYASGNAAEDPAELSIGERDTRLFQLRENMFGPQLYNISACPACHVQLEWKTSIKELIPANQESKPSLLRSLDVEDYHIVFRLLNSYDLIKAFSDPAYKKDPRKLLADCILEIKKENEDCNSKHLPETAYDKIEECMSSQDPQADIRMLLNCPACRHRWEMPFDIASYIWIEIDNWAKRILHEVAILASAFGWSESAILSMTQHRRQLYLAMINR